MTKFLSFFVFLQLLFRDLLALKKRAFKIMIDNVVMLIVEVLLMGYMFPALGMSRELIGPVFVGTALIFFFTACHGMNVALVEDLEHTRFIDYYSSLPISTNWVIAKYIVKYMIETSCIVLPFLFFGVKLLGDKFVIVQTSPGAFLFIYLLGALFFATLFLTFAFRYDYDWFWSNVWSKRIEPLFLFGSLIIVWKKLYAFSKFWGIVFLLNPVTYVAEGVRSALIGGDAFIPFWICVAGTTIGICINLFLLFPSVKRVLDHV